MTFKKAVLCVVGLSLAGWMASSTLYAQPVQTQESSQVHKKKHTVVSKKGVAKKMKVTIKTTKKQVIVKKKAPTQTSLNQQIYRQLRNQMGSVALPEQKM